MIADEDFDCGRDLIRRAGLDNDCPLTAFDDRSFQFSSLCRDALARYAEPLLRVVADKLVRPRTKLPADELLDKAAATLTCPMQSSPSIRPS